MTTTPGPQVGDIVTYWLIAENCLCENNGHPPVPQLERPALDEAVFDSCASCQRERSEGDAWICTQHQQMVDKIDEEHGQRLRAHTQAWEAKYHPLHAGHELREMECGHLRAITGYPARIKRVTRERDEKGHITNVYYQLVVDFPDGIMVPSKDRSLGYIRDQGHCLLATGRPRSGEFTVRV